MLYNPARRASTLDPALIWSATLLACIGLVMVYSASIAMADSMKGAMTSQKNSNVRARGTTAYRSSQRSPTSCSGIRRHSCWPSHS